MCLASFISTTTRQVHLLLSPTLLSLQAKAARTPTPVGFEYAFVGEEGRGGGMKTRSGVAFMSFCVPGVTHTNKDSTQAVSALDSMPELGKGRSFPPGLVQCLKLHRRKEFEVTFEIAVEIQTAMSSNRCFNLTPTSIIIIGSIEGERLRYPSVPRCYIFIHPNVRNDNIL